ncbi:MAG: S41 family peptidase [Candidatus Pacebacteria bacterium]|nr:S41 family peptidase [Candidatus Paceibacterota bacterium]
MYINKKKVAYSIILVALFVGIFGIGIWVGVNKIAYSVPQPDAIDFSLFWDAYSKLQENFIDPSKIDNQKIIYGAIEGMTKSLDDPYTSFFDPEQAKRFQQDLSGSFEGIGAEIGVKKEVLTIIAPLSGTPAEKAGLKSGDLILKIDGKDATNMTTDEAVNLIRGQGGTVVTLNIFREGWSVSKDIEIVRDTIIVPTMDWKIMDNNIAYIHINEFGETLPADFKTAAMQILQGPAKKIVLDLRGNPGGYLEAAQNIAGWFLKQGQTVVIEDFGQGKTQQVYKAQGNASLVSFPVVVLIDQGSASASEILAGALRDNRNIKLVGIKSFGKGSVQEFTDLRGGSFLKITIAKWLTPNGSSISEVGLSPDIKVEITEQDAEAKKDPQLDKALEIISNMK